jgi:hypothetical protein
MKNASFFTLRAVLCFIGLLAFFCTVTSAQADAQESRIAPIHAEPVSQATVEADAAAGLATAVSNPVLGDTRPRPVVERRYKVEALNFRCLDETWYDSPWFAPWISDEVMVILRDPERKVLTVSRVFGDVDTNETRIFGHHEKCILPVRDVTNDFLRAPRDAWSCGEAGVSGPFSFTVEMYEADSDDWNGAYNCFIQFDCGFSVLLPGHYPVDSANFTEGDELIGKRTLVFPVHELEQVMPNVGDTFEETIKLGPCHDERGCVESPGLPTGPEYTFTWRLTRLPNRILEPVVDPNP